MDTQDPDQKRHIRQAFADLVFGLALFAIFVLLGLFGVKQPSSQVSASPAAGQPAPLLKHNPGDAVDHILLPLSGKT